MKPKDLTELSAIACSAAREAGALIRAATPSDKAPQSKVAGTSAASQVITEVDLRCQTLILSRLRPSIERFDLGLLTEESTDDHSRFEKKCFWCIDPLDGTLPFVEGQPGYAVSIALVERSGTPLLGAIYDPVEQTLYHAVSGQGAFCNGVPIERSQSAARFTLVADRSFAALPQFPNISERIRAAALASGCSEVATRLLGGAVMNACWVLENGPACYLKFPKPEVGGGSIWDYAATAILFHEAGAVATDYSGRPLDLNRSDSTFMNHRGILYASSKSIFSAIKKEFRSSDKFP